MWQRPIHRLTIRSSVRELHALELCIGRYVGLLGAIAVATRIFPVTDRTIGNWSAFLLLLAAFAALFQPWHRELHLSMDSYVLRLRRVALGVVPFARREYPLEGRRLAVERRVVEVFERDNSGLGCLLLLLPAALGWIVSGLASPTVPAGHATQWVLCLRGEGFRTDDLALLKSAPVAARFLAAAEEIQPEHVERA